MDSEGKCFKTCLCISNSQLADEVTSRMETGQVLGTTLTQCTVLEGDKEPPDIRPFELYLVLQVCRSSDTLLYFLHKYSIESLSRNSQA